MDQLPFGGVLRGLHFFGASFIVIAALVHMLRVVALGSYRKPREVTWITGVVLLLLILAFALSGYLLPWDQKAYWATTVTINVARSGPIGEYVAGSAARWRAALGALTLLRWYSAHVFLLPACLIVLHRRPRLPDAAPWHLGPDRAETGPGAAVLPVSRAQGHDRRRAGVRGARGAAATFRAPLDAVADPTDATYVPASRVVFPQPVSAAEVLPGPARAGGDAGHAWPRGGVPVRAALSRPERRPPAARPPDRGGRFLIIGLGVDGAHGDGAARRARPLSVRGWTPLAGLAASSSRTRAAPPVIAPAAAAARSPAWPC